MSDPNKTLEQIIGLYPVLDFHFKVEGYICSMQSIISKTENPQENYSIEETFDLNGLSTEDFAKAISKKTMQHYDALLRKAARKLGEQ